MPTDHAWEQWGEKEPYFGVITHEKYRTKNISAEAKEEFFTSGERHVTVVMEMIRHFIRPEFSPVRALDFGCGVGRIAIPLAKIANEVVGADVAESMLEEAQVNCTERGAANVTLVKSDDMLSSVSGTFDLIHSVIVFQHIPPTRGIKIFKSILTLLAPGGVGALHFTYAKAHYAERDGVAPEPAKETEIVLPGADPEMQMNSYNLNQVFFLAQAAGIKRVHFDFSDHGGELGVFLFFEKPP